MSDSELIIPVVGASGEDLYLADVTDADKRTRLTTTPGRNSLPALSPNRRSMIYAHSVPPGKGALWVAGVDGSGPRPLFEKVPAPCVDGISRPGWNAKVRTQIVVWCKAGNTVGLYLLDTDGHVLRKLYESTSKDVITDPAVSPDGTQVVYQAQRASETGLYVVALDGKSEPRRITSGNDNDPVWSPVAPGRLAFRRAFSSTSAIIFVTNVDGPDIACAGASRRNEIGGGKLCQLTDGRDFDQDPTWSPDGKQIVFKHRVLAPTSIQVVTADGKGTPKPIWNSNPGNQNAPAWTIR